MTAYKTTAKNNKSTRNMTAEELKRLRLEMGFDKVSLSHTLSIPYRTLQDYESGRRGIPATFADKMRAAHHADRTFMANRARLLEQELSESYPHGIPSEITQNADDNFS